MRGASAASRRSVLEALDPVLEGDVDASRLGDELFAVAGLLDSEPALRRTVTDPATDAQARAQLTRAVLSGQVDEATVELVAAAAGQRWSASRELADTLEHAGALAHVVAAESDGSLEDVEDELFRFARIVSAHPQLRDSVSDRRLAVAARQELVAGLLADRATSTTLSLANQAVAGRHRSIFVALDEFQQIAAQRRKRLVATVTVAAELAADDRQRLADALSSQYDRQVHLNVVIDPDILGGVRVDIGDDVVDGSVATRLENARRRIAG